MAVDTRHPAHRKVGTRIKKIRDFMAGRDTAITYVESLPGQNDAEQKRVYQNGASYLPVAKRTAKAFVGAVMNPEPVISGFPEQYQALLDDAGNNGEPFNRLAARLVGEVLQTDRVGLCVDFPKRQDGEDAVTPTLAMDEAENVRPYARLYPFEQIISWHTGMVGNVHKLLQVRLAETYTEPDPNDKHNQKVGYQIRVLYLDERGHYAQEIYRAPSSSLENRLAEPRVPGADATILPQRDGAAGAYALYDGPFYPMDGQGQPMRDIPFIMVSQSSLDADAEIDPPLEDLVNLSCDQLQCAAAIGWVIKWLGSPTFVISGMAGTDDKGNPVQIKVGAATAMIIGPDASAEIVALGSEGMSALKETNDDFKKDMAAMGARMIMFDGAASAISTDTERIRRAGEHSVLAEVAHTCSDAMTKVLKLMVAWSGGNADNSFVTLNDDFLPVGLQPGELTEWVGALQTGTLPLELFLKRLQDRGVADPEMDAEAYRSALDEDSFGMQTEELDDEDDEDEDQDDEDLEGDEDDDEDGDEE